MHQKIYLNLFGCHIFTKQISEYIHTTEVAQKRIRIIFYGYFILMFEYSYSSMIEGIFENGSLMLPLNKILHWIFF